jgi:predicted CoA-binding protein
VNDPSTIRAILENARTVAIVGLSPNKLRASHFVAYYLQRNGYRVIPVNPNALAILGERSYSSLREVPVHVDVVDVFRDAAAVPAIAEDAVAVRAGALWLQVGVASEVGADTAARGGLDVVMDRCMKVEHARLLGRMHWLGFNTGSISSKRSHG